MDLVGVAEAVGVLRSAVGEFEGRTLDAGQARSLLDTFIAGERACAAGRTLAAARAEECGAWALDNGRNPAAWLADRMGTSVGQAAATLDTARRMESLPAAGEAFRAGEISEAQALEIAAVAVGAPEAEQHLLDTAASGGLRELKNECERVRAAGEDVAAAEARAHARRRLRTWNGDGGRHLHLFASRAELARLEVAIASGKEAAFARTRSQGRREAPEAYAADGLLALADGNGPGVKGHVVVRVDAAALARGHVVGSEICEIDGMGPIPVARARQLALDGVVTALEVDGTDVGRVVSATRHIPAALRVAPAQTGPIAVAGAWPSAVDGIVTALALDGTDVRTLSSAARHIPAALRAAVVERDRSCSVARCGATERLEIDHVVPFAMGGPTSYHNLERKCPVHHGRKTADDMKAILSRHRERAGPDPPG